MPLVFGVDVARFGGDKSVVFPRRGLVAQAPIILSGQDNVEAADRIVSLYHEYMPHSIFVDAGQGQGVIDILKRNLRCVYEIPFGGQALDPAKFINRRSEMWFLMREWIRSGGKIPDTPELVSELSAPVYSFNATGKIQLEKKESIKERIGRSPDLADALALTFAVPVMPDVGDRQEYAITQRYALGARSLFGNHNDYNNDDNDDDYGSPSRQKYADGVDRSLFSLWE